MFDLWVQSWRKKQAVGDVYVVRYADDLMMGFQSEEDARAMHRALSERMAKFGLELHPEKTAGFCPGGGVKTPSLPERRLEVLVDK